ncbi:16S rRNA methyltransferase [Alkalihalobacillus alcalophilus ATCC 27647 = CGMCC 1.3604]|uniref:16S rRNA (cytosine(967)-C(5))-methyltransferase n=1 Tax=Alkalihalobacillus alcalophilus ATCC 27647 = CGMCC 1.3604 TaxID=1218173 RepID=A0A094WP52_ALKAL|nr:16S rRNA (cytosine(967)-C(5))-methyltransferase RsmB [Alkalihalobacillus alcalophilus]KGA97743.1 16S rRNA methyltransferase [Alkalihalobacillus alcalophilus ATCC 27647 = CGMCC 1.3604]MED1563152.1 16S rRNA (cytosine(967)-C(5))-methyltransferase RsmB [Alkalihalobacillus alcalophilus]THG91817.1 16S rRNA methyltransferase [Alkalihalobacillus alcalophilus ATCC 27647 = CGMCC 1.3604]
MSKNVREVALQVLIQIEKEQAYSNLLLNQTINSGEVEKRDIGLLTELVYGTVQRKLTLTFFLTPFVKKGLESLEPWVKTLLQMSVYQLVYLERVPERAVIHEAVTIAKKRGHDGTASLVNGILRSVQREGVPSFEKVTNQTKRLAFEYSFPKWMVRRWLATYGEEETREMMKVSLKPPVVSLRVNQLKTNQEDLMKILKEEGVLTRKGELSSDALIVEEGNAFKTNAYRSGLFTAQDESSMLVAKALGPKAGEHILDSCAAPGGKSTHIAELMNNEGSLLSVDLHEHKVQLIREQAKRLDLSMIEVVAADVRAFSQKTPAQSFDAILLDAPCSGLGVIRRKPDIKWAKKESDIQDIAEIQAMILEAVAPLLKKGGRLVYSTCTIDQEENEAIVEHFIQTHPEFQWDITLSDRLPEEIVQSKRYKDGYVTILPHDYETDGFFIASLKKK